MGQKLLRAAAYLRLSKEDASKKKESNSIENQRKIIQIFCRENPEYVLVDEFIDDGRTGLNFNREGYFNLKTAIKNNDIDTILVKDLSRFGRKAQLVRNEIDLLLNINDSVNLYAISERIDARKDIDSFYAQIHILFNEEYSKNISNKILQEVESKHKLGMFLGAHASYGYKKDPNKKNHLIVDDYAAEIVKEIFETYLEGKHGKQKIARNLNKRGILCPSEYKKSQGENYRNSNKLDSTTGWTYSTIQKILKNRMYAGDLVQHKTNCSKFYRGKKTLPEDQWIIVENTHEALIPKEKFFMVQDALNLNTRELDFSPISLFAGIMKCGECGKALVKTKANGKITYVCSKYKTTGECTRHPVKEEEIAQYILDSLNLEAKAYSKELKRITKQQNVKIKSNKDYKDNVLKINKRIEEARAYIRQVRMDKVNKIIDEKSYIYEMNQQNDVIQKYEKQLAQIEAKGECTKMDEIKNNPVTKQLLSGKFDELTREMLITYVDKITVCDDGNVEVLWKFDSIAPKS